MGGALTKGGCPGAAASESKLEARIIESMRRREAQGCTIKSFNSIILKFPKIDESLRNCKAAFENFGKYQSSMLLALA